LKSQKHNQGELKELVVKIEKSVCDKMAEMSKKTKTKMDDHVVVALKRYISSHCDYLENGGDFKDFSLK
jgi:hypothetical protein